MYLVHVCIAEHSILAFTGGYTMVMGVQRRLGGIDLGWMVGHGYV
jgi:hypothetical protein